jgi:hypothetical protein
LDCQGRSPLIPLTPPYNEMYEGGKRGHKGYLVLDTSNANQIKHSAPRQNKLNPANVIIRQNLGNKSSYIPITAVIQ